jgi:hypothetical protein
MTTPMLEPFSSAPAEYHSYLVRLWRPAPQAEWRLMVERIPGGERRGFATLEALCLFLQKQIRPPEEPAADEKGTLPP